MKRSAATKEGTEKCKDRRITKKGKETGKKFWRKKRGKRKSGRQRREDSEANEKINRERV